MYPLDLEKQGVKCYIGCISLFMLLSSLKNKLPFSEVDNWQDMI